ncbi:MAG: ATP-binding protein [Polyangiaceae bacterium]|nr:ATP-binding protein [Polyangiaceae bacterium]
MTSLKPDECSFCARADSLAVDLAGGGPDVPLGWALAPLAAAAAVGAVCVGLGLPAGAGAGAAAAAGLAGAVACAARARRRAALRLRRIEATLSHFKAHGQEHDALTKTAADINPDAIVLYGDEGTIKYANPAARDLFFDGAPAEGKDFLAMVDKATPALRAALLGEADSLVTLEVGGQSETHHITRRPYNLGGRPNTLIIVKHLTREIARREVETLKRVVRVISHEVNNSLAPIASLVGSARLLVDRPDGRDKLARAFDTIEERAQHLRGFLDGYARLARLPAPSPREVAWAALLERLRSLHPQARLPAAPIGSGWFDAAQIEQALINLFKNAAEAGSAPEAIELAIEIGADGSQRLEVRDRGRGFSREALASALMPFYTTKEKGSGLGLPLCREIVEAHGGSLSLAERDGGGAVVTLVLPGNHPGAARSRAKLTLAEAREPPSQGHSGPPTGREERA